ncbi:hypothetical protein BC567DRAFT_229347 [Phyllosticta citribraziliensis]
MSRPLRGSATWTRRMRRHGSAWMNSKSPVFCQYIALRNETTTVCTPKERAQKTLRVETWTGMTSVRGAALRYALRKQKVHRFHTSHSPWSSLSIRCNKLDQVENQMSKRISKLLSKVASDIQRSWQASLGLGLVARAEIVECNGAIHQSACSVDEPATCRLHSRQ